MSPLTPEQSELAARYMPLARSIARRYKSRFPRHGDLIDSAAHLGLVHASGKFDATRGASFRSYAHRKIGREILSAFRADRPKGYRGWLEEPPAVLLMSEIGEPEFDFSSNCTADMAIAASPDEPPSRPLDDRDEAERLLRRLPWKASMALMLVCLEGLKHADAGLRMGCSKSEVMRQIGIARTLLSPIA